jgi:hypothetical protein
VKVGSSRRAYQESAAALYPDAASDRDYTSIVNPRHYARLQGLIEDARAAAGPVLLRIRRHGSAQSADRHDIRQRHAERHHHARRAGRSTVRRRRRQRHRAYHGIEGFKRLSHAKGIYAQSRWNVVKLFRPPFGTLTDRILNFMLR